MHDFAATAPSREPVERRRTVVASPALGRAEVLEVTGLTRARMPTVHSPEFQVLFPLTGVFRWHIGNTSSLVDPNQLLFITAGDESEDSHPSVGDVQGFLVTPEPALLERTWGADLPRLPALRPFAARVLPSAPAVQQLAAAIAHCGGEQPEIDELEESVFALLSLTARHADSRASLPAAARATPRIVAAVKEIVAAAEGRVTLAELARELNRSPAWLTEAFRRSEGVPIARYHRRLRLARALAELPHTDDLTALALRLGFSSHAHFSSAFRAEFGRTPSEYRARARRRDLSALLGRLRTGST
jgi:AraC-like DNA-binding protein